MGIEIFDSLFLKRYDEKNTTGIIHKALANLTVVAIMGSDSKRFFDCYFKDGDLNNL
jgi:hypothetical protein